MGYENVCIRQRLKCLVCKLLSFKFTVLILSVVLRSFNLLTSGELVAVITSVLACHAGIKGIDRFLEGAAREEGRTEGGDIVF